jgi:hypothetical protein
MKTIDKLKNHIGKWQLANELKGKHKNRKLLSFQQMQHVGVLYNATFKEQEDSVNKYVQELRTEGKKVFMLGYVDAKELPHSKKFMLNSEFFWHEKLNGINLPIKGKIGQFLQIEFDVLFNLYLDPLLPLQAVSGYSNALYRVGPLTSEGALYYDFMMNIGNKSELDFFITQIDFYLRNIK